MNVFNMMNAKITIVLMWTMFCAGVSVAQQVAKGYVYEDSNKNGVKDRNEKGIANVAVSNGLDVMLTDKNGLYKLPVEDDNILFVIKPEGYQVLLDTNNIPRFYHIHKPLGSPDSLKFAGVEPTGELPRSVDFALYPVHEESSFRCIIFGDPQMRDDEELEYFEKGVVRELVGEKDALFGISLGDLAYDNLAVHPGYKNTIGKIGLPWYQVLGNHDMNLDVGVDSLSDETYERNFGPPNYAFNYGNAHFIVLDNILYPDPRGITSYYGGFRKDQLTFIANNLKYVPKDKLIILAFHIPLLSPDFYNNDVFNDEDRKQLFSLLSDYPNTLSLSAHTHLQRHNFYTEQEGWMQDKPHHEFNIGTTSGDWYSGKLTDGGYPPATMRDGTFRGYAFLNIDDNTYTIDYKSTGEDADFVMNITAPSIVPQGNRSSYQVHVNFFIGTPTDVVEFRVDSGPWKQMTSVLDFDPYYLHLQYEWDMTAELLPGRRPSAARQSTHLWRAALPTNLPLGTRIIEVRARDMFGRVFTQKKPYLIDTLN